MSGSDKIKAPDGILLLAHGSRDPLWKKPIEAVAQEILKLHPSVAVGCAYLELSAPSLPDAAAQMVAQLNSDAMKSIASRAEIKPGSNPKNIRIPLCIRILPLFLGMGKHAREDLPVLAEALRKTHPQVDFELASPVVENERVIRLLAQLAIA